MPRLDATALVPDCTLYPSPETYHVLPMSVWLSVSNGQGLVSRESSYVVQPEISWRGTVTQRATVVMVKHDSEPDWFTVLEGDSVFLIASLAPVASLGIRGRTQWNVFIFRDRGSFIAQ